jgi:hypothetical protein
MLTRRFAKGELDVHVGNRAKVAAIAIGTLPLAITLKISFGIK